MTNSELTQKHLQAFFHSISDQAFILIFSNLQYLCYLKIKVTIVWSSQLEDCPTGWLLFYLCKDGVSKP